MRFGSVLQRRLVKLESTIKVPSWQETYDQIVSQALNNLSVEDLRLLRDVAEMQAAGSVVNPTPEYEAVIRRAHALYAEALADYNASLRKARGAA
jgi:hypothetical protein